MELFKRWAAEHGQAAAVYLERGDLYLAMWHAKRAWHFAEIWMNG